VRVGRYLGFMGTVVFLALGLAGALALLVVATPAGLLALFAVGAAAGVTGLFHLVQRFADPALSERRC
jgi:hypothetical protein